MDETIIPDAPLSRDLEHWPQGRGWDVNAAGRNGPLRHAAFLWRVLWITWIPEGGAGQGQVSEERETRGVEVGYSTH